MFLDYWATRRRWGALSLSGRAGAECLWEKGFGGCVGRVEGAGVVSERGVWRLGS